MITTTLAKSEKWEKKNKHYFFENFRHNEKKRKKKNTFFQSNAPIFSDFIYLFMATFWTLILIW